MADDSRSPNSCPWDPGEVCKAGNGACLPPRKRLLAGLKQNGWLPSSSPYLQSCNGTPCAGVMEELVDLGQANHEYNGDTGLLESSSNKQGECNSVENSVFVKTKKPMKRRKSLSLLADCHSSANNLQPEALKSYPGGRIQKKFKSNKAPVESLSASNGEKGSVFPYREMVDAARAAAAIAAKAAAEAKAIALDKAAAAAKAAAVARAALEALALAGYDKEWELQSRKHVPASRKQRRKGDELKEQVEPKARFIPPLLNGGVSDLSEKREEDERTQIGSARLDKSREDARAQVGRTSTVSFSSVGAGVLLEKIKEHDHTQAGQNPTIDLAIAGVGVPLHERKEGEPTCHNQISSVACPAPPPPPVDDEKLARQLHRAMNSSPRISRSRAPSECFKNSETFPFSTQGSAQNKYPRAAGGCSLSREKKEIPKVKLRVLRTSVGRADVKVKSMSAINETLNLLQGASPSQYRVLGGMVSCTAASDEYGTPVISSHAIAPLIKCNERVKKLTVNSDATSSCKFDAEATRTSAYFSSYTHEPRSMRMDDESSVMGSARVIRKLNLSSRRTEGSMIAERTQDSPQSLGSNGISEMPATRAENQSATFSIAAAELTGSHPEASNDFDQADRDENQGRVSELGLGSEPQVAGNGVKEILPVENFQENSYRDKSGGATRKSSLAPLTNGERQKQRQKILGVLSNGLTKGNQNFGGNVNLSSYIPSPTVS